jgi:WD40 repeat protein
MEHEKGLKGAAYISKNNHILTWSDDRTARLWNAEDGAAIGQPMKHKSYVNGAAYISKKNLILTWSEDGTARLWNAEDGAAIGQPMKHEGYVKGAAYISENNRILTWSDDGTARFWDCGSDLDFPADKLVLQVEVLTGTTMDDFGNITALDYESWKNKREQYLRVAEQHARSCRYKEHNLYLRDIK